MDLRELRAEARSGMQARVTEAVRAHMRGEQALPTWLRAAREVERFRWRAVAAAAVMVLISGVVSSVLQAGPPAPATLDRVPEEWIERLHEAGTLTQAEEVGR